MTPKRTSKTPRQLRLDEEVERILAMEPAFDPTPMPPRPVERWDERMERQDAEWSQYNERRDAARYGVNA